MVVGDQKKYLSCLLTLKVVQDDVTGLPTNQLSLVALDACQRVGSSALTVTDILEKGDHKVLKMIQKGIDHINKRATSKIQRVGDIIPQRLLCQLGNDGLLFQISPHVESKLSLGTSLKLS